MSEQTDIVTCDWCTNRIPRPKRGQRFCANGGACRGAWHRANDYRDGIPATVRNSGELGETKGGGKYVTLYFTEEQARRVSAKPGDTVFVLVE